MSSSDNRTVKVIEVIGESSESWQDAAQKAVSDAAETLEGVSGVEVQDHTAEVEDGEIVQYRTVVHVAFPIQR
jgi:flavin-binding protein dodecin